MEKSTQKEKISELPFMDESLDLEKRVDDLISRLTFEEKIKLSSGWLMFMVKKIKRLKIPHFKMTDGPHGVGATGTFFMGKYTAFPVGICRTATWNPDLAENFGEAAGEEVRKIGRHCILGPGVNIIRSPLCGRNFEYQTEDPYLNKKMVIPIIKGLQSIRIAGCAKHYAANNQEHNRFRIDAQISERALQEIYLPAFKAAVIEADAWSIMSCYNLVNGTYGSMHKDLLRKKLLEKWGFRGFICSDWFATRHMEDTVNTIKAGLTLEMPIANVYKKNKLQNVIDSGEISEENIDKNLKGLIRVMFLTGMFDDKESLPKGSKNTPEHQEAARRIAEEGIVLLKNRDNILPLNIEKIKKIAVLGPNAKKKHIFGGGSSMQRPKYEITPLKGIKKKCKGKIEIIKEPSEADIVILVLGLNHKKNGDRENSDRPMLELPQDQRNLINDTLKANSNTIIVLVNGSPIAMDPWLEKVPAVVEAWYGGMEAGNAIASVLFGEVNPSGKLPVTFPKKLSDCAVHKSFRTYPGIKKLENVMKKDPAELTAEDIATKEPGIVYYDEDIFVGYRQYDRDNIEPLFPFGFGLSYTSFKFSNLQLSSDQLSKDQILKIKIDIKNTGKRAGAEVVQLYIQDPECRVERPPKELKGFKKIYLEPGEEEKVELEISQEDLSFFDEKKNSWVAEEGKFNILIGSSSRDIHLTEDFEYLG
ncbi:MAG: glycosyl hydrolase [Promethearchaeota archaeon]|nr:MAG: glycosyl hydrolase [Candidatus Lokiarchaeota archaeon]